MNTKATGIASSFKSIVKSIISGDILLLLRVDKLFPYILYAFALGWVSIFMSYKMEQTLSVVEKNRTELETLKIYHAHKTCEYVGLDRISTVEEMLKNTGSEVKAPEKPADTIKR
ncbi:MAG: hypothetical protein IKU33_00460 [Bacteroidales bacterium]|nr:hypothetical protein [Bacteroidales bacterium]